MDLEKAFDRVPREVVWWALRCLGVDYYKLCSQIEVPEHSNCRLVPY